MFDLDRQFQLVGNLPQYAAHKINVEETESLSKHDLFRKDNK